MRDSTRRARRVSLPGGPILAALAFLAVFASPSLAGVADSTADGSANATVGYSRVQLHLDSGNEASEMTRLAEAGLHLDHLTRLEDGLVKGKTSFETVVDSQDRALLEASGVAFSVVIEDLAAHYAARKAPSASELRSALADSAVQGFNLGSMGGAYTFTEVVARLDALRSQYPSLISAKQSIGTTIEGRDIWMVKVSDNPDTDEAEPEVLYDSLHHAREPVGMMTLLYFIEYLLENHGTDPEATYLVNERELYFVPVVNPDGYVRNETTNPNGGGLWRKNRRDNGNGTTGVDLNRNYGYEWGFDDTGSSPNSDSDTYRGTGAFSEPETQAIRDLALAREFKVNLSYHTSGNLLLYPWGYAADLFTPDHALYQVYSSEMTRDNGYFAGTANQTVGYVANGGTFDWMYGEQGVKDKIISFTPEVGGSGFWPPVGEIIPQVQANVNANLFLAWIAAGRVQPQPQTVTDQGNGDGFFVPGETIGLTFDLKNIGLGATSGVSALLTTDDPYLTIGTGSSGAPTALASQASLAVGPLTLQVGAGHPVGHVAAYGLRLSQDGVDRDVPYGEVVLGVPSFSETVETGTSGWTTGLTWGSTNDDAHTGTFSFNDSPGTNYGDGIDNRLTLNQPLDLTAATEAYLDFWTRWSIETNYDFGQVEVSTNGGTTWTSRPGLRTVQGSGRGIQSPGEVGYEGTQPFWVRERIDLSDLVGQEVLLRFRLRSDGLINRTGWYIDDLALYTTAGVPFLFADGFETGTTSAWSGTNTSVP